MSLSSSPSGKEAPQAQWRRQLRYLYLRFVRLRATPEAIARGLAAGVFAGWYPLFGLQTIIGIAIASACRGNKLMAAAGTWVSNPLTYLPIYAFNFQIGRLLLGLEDQQFTLELLQSWEKLVQLGSAVILALFLGSTLIGLLSAFLSYWIGLWTVRYIRTARRMG